MKSKMKNYVMLGILSLIMLTLLVAPVSKGNAAAATAAKMELSSDSFLVDSLVTIRVYDVSAAGASCNIYFTYDVTGTDTLEVKSRYANISVYLGSNEDEFVHTMIFPEPTAGAYIRVHVCGTAVGATTDLASDTIYAQKFADIWPDELIITIGISLMVVMIIVGIVLGLATLGSKKVRGG